MNRGKDPLARIIATVIVVLLVAAAIAGLVLTSNVGK